MSQRAAFFDVDGTLLLQNSGPLYVRWLHRQNLVSTGDLLTSFYYALRYKFNLLDSTSFYRTMAARTAGDAESIYKERGQRFFEEVLRSLIRPSMVKAMEEHKERGDVIVILTASTPLLVGPLAKHLGIDHILATELEVDEQACFTGRVLGKPCYGAEKAVRASVFCQEHGLEISKCVAYADSRSDVPLLEVVGEAYAVDPDPLLSRLAKQRNWPILGLREKASQH